jgi:hypothetical protein
MISGLHKPRFLTGDASNIYWTEENGMNGARKQAVDGGYPRLWPAPAHGNFRIAIAPSRIFSSDVSGPVACMSGLDGSDLGCEFQGGPQAVIALDSSYLYWVSTEIVRYPLVNSVPDWQSPTIILALTDCGRPPNVARYGGYLYWACGSALTDPSQEGRLMKAAIDGSSSATLAEHQLGPLGIAADATGVYWTNYFAGTVMKLPAGSATPVVLAKDQDSPMGIALDDTAVYWANNSQSGSIVKVVKDADQVPPPLTDGGVATDAASSGSDANKSDVNTSDAPPSCTGPRFRRCSEPDGPCLDTFTNQAYCGCTQSCLWTERCLQGACVYL